MTLEVHITQLVYTISSRIKNKTELTCDIKQETEKVKASEL